jgi:hypothetical protein
MKTKSLMSLVLMIFAAANVFSQSSVSIGAPDKNYVNSSATVIFEVTYTNANNVNLTSADVELGYSGTSGGTVTILNGATTTPTIQISGVLGNGSYTISIKAGTSEDSGGIKDTGAGPSSAVTVDNSSPFVSSVNLLTPPSSPTNAVTLIYRVTFSESVSGVDISDFNLTTTGTASGTISSLSAESGTNIDVTIESVSGDGTMRLDLKNSGTGIIDLAGNAISGGFTTGQVYTIDQTPPVPVITSSASNPTNTSPIPFTINFSEPVTGFSLSDISVSAGTKGSFVEVNSQQFTFTVTISSDATIQVNISSGVCSDLAGNDNSAASQYTIVFDKGAPEISSIVFSQSSPTNATIIGATIQFNENVTGFTIGDITVVNATLSGFVNVNNNRFTVNASPSGDGTVSLSIVAGVCQDASGNQNIASSVYSIISDRTAPTIVLSSAVSSPTNASSFTVDANISEATTSFNLGSINISNAALSNLQQITPSSYRITVTPLLDGLITINSPAGSFTDLAGNNNISSNQLNVIYDGSDPEPVISSTASNPTNLTAIPVRIDFGEVVAGFSQGDISISGGSISAFGTTNNKVFTFNLNVINPGTYTVNVAAGVCQDMVGNTNIAAPEFSVLFDNVPPVISAVTVPAGVYKVGSMILIAIQADGNTYLKQTTTVNGKDHLLINNGDNTYSIQYLVQEGDNQHNAVNTLPVQIVLRDVAGNTNAQVSAANVLSGTITVDSRTPQINSISSNAEVAGDLTIGNSIIFTLVPQIAEENLIIQPQLYNGKPLIWQSSGSGATYTATYLVSEGDATQVTPLQLGNVSISDAAGNSGLTINYNLIQKAIYATRPKARILGTTSKCDDGSTVPVTFNLEGYEPFQLTYHNGTSSVGPVPVAGFSYTIDVAGGTYTLINLVDSKGNSQTTAIENAHITVNTLPVVSFNIASPYYNLTDPAFNLAPFATPAGGTFSGEGVGTNGWFYPSVVGIENQQVDVLVTYTYTDGNGCKNTSTETIFVVGADGSIEGLPDYTCIDTSPFNITGTSTNGQPGEFIGNGITNISPDLASFNPGVAGSGSHTITYKYKVTGGETDLFIYKNIFVDSLGVVEIFGLNDEKEYCFDSPYLILTASPAGGTFGGGDHMINNRFYPSLSEIGINTITYTKTNSTSGCSVNGFVNVTVHPIPDVHFSVVQSCSDLSTSPVNFINETNSDDPVSSWLWRFDSQGIGSSTEYEPGFIYSTPGSKLVTLYATTINGCTSNYDSIINIGVIPNADFTWNNECLTGTETLISGNFDPTNIVYYRWEFYNGSIIEGGSADLYSVSHLFTETGYHNIKLVITSADNCKDSIEKQIYIQPLINVNGLPDGFYLENFEEGKGYWDARGLTDNGYFSWDFGTPAGNFINFAASGSNAWYTAINFADQKVEKSQAISPCFDLRGIEKPMFKMNLWSSPEVGRDGAVLQYSLNGNNNWQNLGTIGDGINWFNSSTIQSQPGNQFFGWSSMKMNEWQDARISLDLIKDAANVRFRIAYAADGNAINLFDGFAFDDVWIGNREQKLLLEYFTNATLLGSIQTNSDMRNIQTANSSDIAAIHYHSSSPAGDQFYDYYPRGPAAREFFYGISSLPQAIINGEIPFNFVDFSQNQTMLNLEKLKDPKLLIEVVGTFTNVLEVQANIKIMEDISEDEISIFCAVVQKETDIDPPVHGVTRFYNVLRTFLPDPGGIHLKSNWTKDETATFNFNWSVPSSINNADLRVIVFVQNIKTGETYQAGFSDVSGVTSAGSNPVNHGVNIYPNPANRFVNIVSPERIQSVMLVDMMGRTIAAYPGNDFHLTIPVENLKGGIYFVKLKLESEDVVLKFVKH